MSRVNMPGEMIGTTQAYGIAQIPFIAKHFCRFGGG
jgi:hypothetical protein